jgi:hypothetical protein
MNDIILEKISTILEHIDSIERHVSVLNDEHGELVVQVTAIATKVEMIEKMWWIIVGSSVAAILGSVYSLILHKRNGRK